jgi:hypothetical protein
VTARHQGTLNDRIGYDDIGSKLPIEGRGTFKRRAYDYEKPGTDSHRIDINFRTGEEMERSKGKNERGRNRFFSNAE